MNIRETSINNTVAVTGPQYAAYSLFSCAYLTCVKIDPLCLFECLCLSHKCQPGLIFYSLFQGATSNLTHQEERFRSLPSSELD